MPGKSNASVRNRGRSAAKGKGPTKQGAKRGKTFGSFGELVSHVSKSSRRSPSPIDRSAKTVIVTAEEARRMPTQTDFARLDAMTDEDIAQQIASDPDVAPEFTEEMLARAMIIEPKRVPITIKIEPRVLAFFKREGPGYQTRMNAVLRAYAETQMAGGTRRS